jgi:hypothetical protein
MYKKKNNQSVSLFRTLVVGIAMAILSVAGVSAQSHLKITDANPMAMPPIGSYGLRVLAPTVLELTLIATKSPDPATVTNWNFVSSGNLSAPAASQFQVTAGSQSIAVQTVGFKRRPLYAPLNYRDLRIGNYIYLKLATPITEGQTVTVRNSSGTLWSSDKNFSTTADALRYSPAIHVNGEGYMPNYVKKAMVGYYLGNLGEMSIPTGSGFKIVDAETGATVYSGPLVQRRDVGYSYSPVPYQLVYEADFTAFKTPGEYRLQVPGLGASFAFLIDEGIAGTFARSYALGLYHQRCGDDNDYPYTRHQKGACHRKTVLVPDMTFTAVNSTLSICTEDYASSQSGAPRLKDVASSLYPFVNKTAFDASGGHHDAGDYSKYTINVAQLAHSLVFAVDAFAGVDTLDNLGLPESGDGKPDVLQIAKWELDFLAKLQDADGGFYFLVYPKDRRYEDTVSLQGTDLGDQQVVFPKTTAATAASVAALAQAASSPVFKQLYPTVAANYLAKAKKGWAFLEAAWAKYGRDGAYQKITHYGNEFRDRDEIAWAACELYLATGEAKYHTELMSRFDPADSNTRRWTWWRLFEGYGCAIRSYAFAARSGRVAASALNATYLAKCEAEIRAAGDDQVNNVVANAYANPFPTQNKPYRSAGWFMSVDMTFDVVTAQHIAPKQAYIDAIIGAMNFEAGCNPINMGFLTGVNWKRQRETVNQYANNDRRVLPPSGIPLGSIWPNEPVIWQYGNELRGLVYPTDDATSNPYAPYEKWTDTFHVSTEMVNPQQAHSLSAMAWLMAQTSVKSQAWKPVAATITGLPTSVPAKQNITLGLTAPGVDLSKARIVWEARDQDPTPANSFTFAAKNTGAQWVEAEALLPDGRRVFAKGDFNATTATSTPPNDYQSAALAVSKDMVALYHLDSNYTDASGHQGALTKSGATTLDTSNLGWMQNRTGSAAWFRDVGDQATVSIPSSDTWAADTQGIVVEAMVYITAIKGYNRANSPLVSLVHNWASSLEFREDMYGGLIFKGGSAFDVRGSVVQNALPLNTWHHIRMSIDKTGYTVKVNGTTIATKASTDLSNWSAGVPSTLTIGNFDGWVDEVVVRHVRTSYPEEETPVIAAPTISPNGGTFTNSVSVSMASTTVGSTVRYTLNGTEPTSSSTAYSAPLTLTNAVTVKAKAFVSGTGSITTSKVFNVVADGDDTTVTNPPDSQVNFVKSDTSTRGTWKGVYGSKGYNVLGDAYSYPAGVSVSPSGKSDWTWQSSTTDVDGLLKVNSTTDRTLSLWYSDSSFTVDVNVTDGKSHRLALYMVDWDQLGRAQTIQILDANGTVLDVRNVSAFTTGRYLVWDISGQVKVRITKTAGPNAVLNGLFLDATATTPPPNQAPTVAISSPANNSAFGHGENVILTATAADSDGTVSKVEFFSGTTKLGEVTSSPYTFLWNDAAAGSYTVTAKATDNDGAISTSVPVSFTVEPPETIVAIPTISPKGGTFTNSVIVSLDCATEGATIRYTTDGSTPTAASAAYTTPFTLVSSKTVKAVAFSNGVSSGVASGAFTIEAGATMPGAKAVFIRSDYTTKGNWKGIYGTEGFHVIGDGISYPSYATVWSAGKQEWIWRSSSTESVALRKSSSPTDRILALWYSKTNFTVDINITDGKAHRLALYFVDWDKLGRNQRIEIIDATTGQVLNTRNISKFTGGRYLVWDISGKVKIRFTRTGGPNCLLNGIFFNAVPPPAS